MSLVGDIRREALSQRQHELTQLASRHATDVLALFRVHASISQDVPIDTFLNTPIDHVAEDEAAFLKQNDLSTGHTFDTSQLVLLPPPPATTPPSHQDAPIYVANPSSTLCEPSSQVQSSVSADVNATTGFASSSANLSANADRSNPNAGQSAPETPPAGPSLAPQLSRPSRQASAAPDDQDVAPAKVALPQPEEQANLSSSAQQLVDHEVHSKPAKVVHLSSEEVQEQRLQEREADLEQRRQSETEVKSSQRPAAPPNELASSPSSTVGPYSASTPQPPQESPDTSPESEGEQVEVPPPKDLQPSAEEERAKEEHDRILEAQKEIARKQALGDVAETPDEQLKWEEREAAARDAEERAAREAIGGPEPDNKDGRGSTEAEQAVSEMGTDVKPSAEPARDDGPSEPQVKASPVQQPAAQDDGDYVAVARRNTSQPALEPAPAAEADTTTAQPSASVPSSTAASSRRSGMTTRVSSGAMRQKSVSEILGQSQSPPPEQPPSLRKEASSPVPMSPLSMRHPQENIAISSLPRQVHQTALPHRAPCMSTSALEQLETLRGASEDPERDYLEPLFRIQAHEAQNSGTRTLGDLIKMVPKALSTEDHFTAIHERLDFRMLRRIYQLQNANKWSLRQMEKVKEPEQPVSHLDHMMREMKWMRKDFKAERKMKKSVCAWLAQRCAEWVNAEPEQRSHLQVQIKAKAPKQKSEPDADVPDLEQGGDSAPEDDNSPPTPRSITPLPKSLVVAPELAEAVEELQKSGKLFKALAALPKTGLLDRELKHQPQPVTSVSKFIKGKILPKAPAPPRKRSRYDYEDEAEVVDAEPASKRLRDADHYPAEEVECALFHPNNKPVRDRLHSNNAFRPPSEFVMPTTSFYEYRSGSQWIWEDDQKLRKLAKEYSFNWSLIADEMALPTRYKSSAERRTPWECFERWVELESLPADMRKTVYFKTWFQRLEQSQQAAERRYQAQVAHIQQQAAQSGGPTHVPLRRRTTPTRVEKRRSTRYLWMVDGFRKLAKRREQAAWKQAENARAAAQRKSQTEAQPAQKMVKMTPQEFSKKRHERDMQILEAQKQHRQKMIEAQQRQIAQARAAQAGGQQLPNGVPNGVPPQQRPPGPGQAPQQGQMPNGQLQPNVVQNGAQQPARMPMAPQRNGHLAPPQVNAQGIPQAQMQARGGMAPPPNMQQMGPANAQGRNPQYANQQQYPMQNGNMSNSGGSAMTTAQQLQQNQALLQAYHQQQANGVQAQNMNHTNSNPQLSASSPSMPPPPTPQSVPQQLSSGHVPQIIAIQNQIRAQNPGVSEENLKVMATQQMTKLSQSSQARQTAINAATGISTASPNSVQSQYANNQSAYQRNGQLANGQSSSSINGTYANGGESVQTANMSPSTNSSSPSQQQLYAQNLQYQQRKLMQQQMQSHSPHGSHAQLNGSPSVNHASPSMAPASPSLQYSSMNQTSNPMPGMSNQRPPSRSNTPQTQRIGSSGSGAAMGNGVQSPGSQLQGSPRNMQASMAR